MIEINCEYNIKEDTGFILEAEKINKLELSEETKVSRNTLEKILKNGKTTDEVCEKIYSYAYKRGYRINAIKEELLKEKSENILFHGSRNGLMGISVDGSRENCDFGKGFYLGETYNQALAFVCEKMNSSVYAFSYSLKDLKIKKFECTLEWMLAICYYRGTLGAYQNSIKVNEIISEIGNSDVIIAPIADNKMFYIMAQFTEGEINADAALHSLAASGLGRQFVFRTDQAMERLSPIEKYYISIPEREDCRKTLVERGFNIDTKLKLAKRGFKSGLYIEELFDERV